MIDGYYPDDVIDTLEDLEDMLMFEAYGGLIF